MRDILVKALRVIINHIYLKKCIIWHIQVKKTIYTSIHIYKSGREEGG